MHMMTFARSAVPTIEMADASMPGAAGTRSTFERDAFSYSILMPLLLMTLVQRSISARI